MIPAIAITWFGMILGVSFLATPVKFRADSLTLPVALDVGRTTFHAFGRVEWLLGFVLLFALVQAQSSVGVRSGVWPIFGAVTVILLMQKLWLIPVLDTRVAAIIDGQELAKSHLHTVYATSEGVKAILLLTLGLLMNQSGPTPQDLCSAGGRYDL